jgi:PrtD family type I secretion system ABC transporter
MHGAPVQPFRLATAMRKYKGAFVIVGLLSGLVNLLALTGSMYMLQVYDRVLPSRSVPTLVGLTALLVILYVAYGLLDLIRTRVMARIGFKIDRALRAKIFEAVLLLPLRAKSDAGGLQPIRDLDQIRSFLSGLGPTALFDIPWLPLYLGLIYLLHPLLGLFALLAAILLIVITLVTELKTAGPTQASSSSGAARMIFAEHARRNAEVLQAMGMARRAETIWLDLTNRHLRDQLMASDASSGIGTFSKIFRLLLQSGMLGLGAYLAIRGEVSAGVIIAGTITLGRALAPIELAIQHWKGFVGARQSYARLKSLFATLPVVETPMSLPRPSRALHVEGLTVAAPGQLKPIVFGVSFELQAGSGLGIIGPSASGKSTLARALVGVWLPVPRGGSIRLDGAALDQFGADALGRDIGYLPQDIELFDGTVSENIARLDSAAKSEDVIKAAQLAGCHDMILQLAEGYKTRIGESGALLSAGQRQRVALARALYGEPFLVVLDEPNSNLDAIGDFALAQAIKSVRARGGIVIMIAHRPSALNGIDQLLALAHGQAQAFGPKDEVLKRVLQGGSPVATANTGATRPTPVLMAVPAAAPSNRV